MAAEKMVHFVIMPMLAQGHIIPMVDFGLLLASRGMRVSVITTPLNAARIQSTIDRAKQLDLPIDVVKLRFPYAEVGLPEGYENIDMVTSDLELAGKVMGAIAMLEEQLIEFLRSRPLLPTCLIADFYLSWSLNVAHVANIPRYVFYSMCCFTLYCNDTLPGYYEKEGIPSGSTRQFEVPGLQHHVMISRAQAPGIVEGPAAEAISKSDRAADGIILNTFKGLEPEYVESYSKAVGNTVWTVGPVSLFDREPTLKFGRGGVSTVSEREVVEWLDIFEPKSVIYVCLGSFGLGDPRQVEEMALGLEGSCCPFILVVGTDVLNRGVEEFMRGGFEERVRGKGLVIRGWAPQMVILSHPSIGGFLTHCGWNSTLEAIAGGIPMATWPCLFDQFLNERLAVDVIGTGVAVGIEKPFLWWGEEPELVGREKVRVAVEKLMGEGVEMEAMRRRATELREKARRAMEEGGSSHVNITGFIQDALRRATEMSEKGKC